MKVKTTILAAIATLAFAASSAAHDETPYGTTFCGSYPGDVGSYWRSPATAHWWRDWFTGTQYATAPGPINTSGYTRWEVMHEIQHDVFLDQWRGAYRSNRFCGFLDLPNGVSPTRYGYPVR